MTIPAMLKVLFTWLADRLEGGDPLQRPSGDPACPSSAKAAKLPGDPCQGPWFSLKVDSRGPLGPSPSPAP